MRKLAVLVLGLAAGAALQRMGFVREVMRVTGIRPYGRAVSFASPTDSGLTVAAWRELMGTPPLTLLVFGQSHAANFGERTSVADSVWIYSNGRIHRASEPVPGVEGSGGSVWPRLASRIERTGQTRLLIIPVAIGGTVLDDWGPNAAAGRALDQLVQSALRVGLTINASLVMIGEADVIANTPSSSWVSSFRSLSERLGRLGLGSPILVATETRCFGVSAASSIARSQREVVDGDRIRQGPDLDAIGHELRWDGCHFSARGLDSVAALWVAAIDRAGLLARTSLP